MRAFGLKKLRQRNSSVIRVPAPLAEKSGTRLGFAWQSRAFAEGGCVDNLRRLKEKGCQPGTRNSN